MKKLLLVVDYQNDFVNGALGFEGAQKLENGICTAIEQTLENGGHVLITRDTHQNNYLQTREGKHLPIAHCIEGTQGHELFGKLHQYEKTPHENCMIINKPTFGCDKISKHVTTLCKTTPDVIEICGLVTDICVISNAILLHSSFLETEICVLENLIGSGNKKNAESAIQIMHGLGIKFC